MGWIADLLKEIPSAARYKAELEKLEAEHNALAKENAALKQRLREAELAAASSDRGHLDETREKILVLLQGRELFAEQLADELGFSTEKTDFHLRELLTARLISNVLIMNRGARWLLSQEGRRYLNDRGLLK